jgi:Flp pilus assembly protein TadB
LKNIIYHKFKLRNEIKNQHKKVKKKNKKIKRMRIKMKKKTIHEKLGLKNKIEKILVVSLCVLLFIIFHV